jgi:hypothetical protein
MFDRRYASRPAPESAAWVERLRAAARAENRAAAEQLVVIGQLFADRYSSRSETDEWAIDTEAAVAAEVGAALLISQGRAASRLRYARAMRERLPQVGEVFQAGDIDYRAFTTIVYRSDLITDPDVLSTVDAAVAANVTRWPSMTQGRLGAQIDKIVARADADAVRRRTEQQAEREIWIGGEQEGLSQIIGSLFSVDAHVLDRRLSALAATVCEHDPRTVRASFHSTRWMTVANATLWRAVNAAQVVEPFYGSATSAHPATSTRSPSASAPEGAFSWGVRVLFGPGRFGRMRTSPSRRWSSSHPCGRVIRRSGRLAHRGGG